MSARLVGLVGGVVVSSGFIYSLRRNIEKDLNIHRENLADIDYELKTAFLPEHEQAIIDVIIL
ncbi:hypothetical protein CONCODRAFT_146304 [Conidiobolus coronatus NRRL 28638]|uniref:Uncharacterized protein n=1 Tax=Conidiobolus coronatus (strain ATCC 28846 / CBS 209.66 / NRRL 28638) TaxID=796925 RepID=A0A137P9N9_CONC2|nr:hypothetical protein CONCODRAFT_146304 [Conidiobolus coronatus NRRL 28638]|eukprot:KXN71631.1 hypothetical protein CONCODRAFT_146304 [Conidiobolus coronatus NRRL 28638]